MKNRSCVAVCTALLAAACLFHAHADEVDDRNEAAARHGGLGQWLQRRSWGTEDERGHWYYGWTATKRYAGRASSEDRQPAGCCKPTAANFPMVGGNPGQQMYSSLRTINEWNARYLGGAWSVNLEGGAVPDTSLPQQNSAVVEDGVIYVQTTQGNVFAVDGVTGQIKWRYESKAGAVVRRGLALGQGKVFGIAAGKRVFALDKSNGSVVWEKRVTDFDVYILKTAVMYHDGLIYFGSSDSLRGTAYAMNAVDGEIVWRFVGAPEAGQFGSETWEGESWKLGGASPWMHPAIDPDLGLVYFTFGNARQGVSSLTATNASTRGGNNLFANSIVAIDAKTGQRRWHFQSVHHDIWDLDNTHAPVLADITIKGVRRKAVFYGSKTGMLYILDRATGKPLIGIDEQVVPQEPRQKTAATQPIPRGDPFSPVCLNPLSAVLADRPVPNYTYGCIFTPFWDKPVTTTPGHGGAADWSAYSFSPDTGLLYIGTGNIASGYTNSGYFYPLGEYRSGRLVAMDPRTNRIAWEKRMPWSLAHGNGILTTAGGVLFIGQPDGNLLALDIDGGKELWRFQTGAGVHTNPITYSINGVQYVAVFAGGSVLPYNSQRGAALWAFKLGGRVPQAVAPPAPSVRQPIVATPVAGSAVGNTVVLGRGWDTLTMAPRPNENTTSAAAIAPQILVVAAGATVTFTNPVDNVNSHCADGFFDNSFNSGALLPGQSFTYTFTRRGEYFFNNCLFPNATGKIVVE